LHQERRLCGPRGDGAEARQFLFHLGDLGIEQVEGSQVLAHVQLFGGREVQTCPPGAVLGGKGIAVWGGEIVNLRPTMYQSFTAKMYHLLTCHSVWGTAP